MVQQIPGGPPLTSEGFYTQQRESSWSRNERTFLNPSQEPRPPVVQRPNALTIDSALKNHVAIEGLKRWALIVQTDDAEPRVYSSNSLRPHLPRVFTEEVRGNFMDSALQAEAAESYPSLSYQDGGGMYGELDSDNRYDTRKHSSESDIGRRHRKSRSEESEGDGSVSAKRRRKGYRGQFREKSGDEMPAAVSQRRQELEIGDDAKVDEYYCVRFKDMQQSACKVMGKAFVKLVEPKKQTHYPYTKGSEKAPPWWPALTGENGVRHREPDHLLKPERVRLLLHILKMVVEPPHKQHPTVKKLNLNVKALEVVTMEAMSTWFADKDHPEYQAKRPYLKELFKVARSQERYKNGEIDSATKIPVRFGESMGVEDESEGDGDNLGIYEDDAGSNSVHIPTPPESLVSPSMGQHQQFQQQQSDEATMRLPIHFPNRSVMDMGAYDNQAYRGTQYQLPQSPIDSSRRNIVFPSPQHNTFPSVWSNPVTSAPVSGYYTTSPQSTLPPFPSLPPLPQTQPTHMGGMVHSYDGLNRYDTSPSIGNQLRTGSMSHPHHIPNSASFPDYPGSDSNQYNQHFDLKDDHQHHLHQQN